MGKYYDELTELEDRFERGAGDGRDFPDNPDTCEFCGGTVVVMTDNYGADADGRRGITVQWLECDTCGEQPGEGN